MLKSKVINLLKKFSKEEFKEFGLFMESTVYNRETVLIKLYSILKKHYPGFEGNEIKKEIIFRKLFPSIKYNDALMRNTISDLLRMAEEYLKYKHFRKDAFYNQYLLLKELTNRKQKALFIMNFKKAGKLLQTPGIRDEIYYQNNFLLEDERRRNIVVHSSKVLYKDDNLSDQAKKLHVQHLVENIKLYAIMLNQKKFIHDHKFDFTLLETLREYLEKNYEKYKDIPYITIFYNCVMLYKTEEKEYFNELKSELKKHYKKLSVTDRKNMFMVLTNYSNSQIKKGRFEFYRENFEIYKELLRTKAYLEADFIQHYIYNAIAQNAILVNELDWAEKFINSYKNQMHSDFRESTYNYCLTHLLLWKGNYDKALESLSKVQTFDISFKLNVNHTLLMIYFCKNETDSFISLVDSFRHFLKRNRNVRKEDHLLYNNFITLTKKLYNLKLKMTESGKADIAILKKEIENNNEVSSKKWLLNKVDELL